MKYFPKTQKALLTEQEQKELASDNDAYYQLQLSRITEEHLNQLTDHDKETHAIFIKMNKGTNLTSNIVKQGATEEEIAVVNEHLEEMPGVYTDVDWNRTYPSVAQWHPIYGRVSTYEQGLPATSSGYYLAHDYQSNDRVGLSQLEYYYEDFTSRI